MPRLKYQLRWLLATVVIAVLAGGNPVRADDFNVSYLDGGTWNAVYAQGFNTALGATANSASSGDTVALTQFQFFKSGNSDSASNIQLAIMNNMYPKLNGLTTSDASFVGLSTNTIADTGAFNLWDPIAFYFNNLPLVYGNDYCAMFVTADGSGNLTPILVSALTANYGLQGDGFYHPQSNYGTESQYQYTTTNGTFTDSFGNEYFSAFDYYGDANFYASLSTVPEPVTSGICGIAALGLGRRRMCRRLPRNQFTSGPH